MSDIREQHSALNARDDMLAIADAWPDLIDRLGKESSSRIDGMPKPASREVGLVINESVSQVMADVREWVTFLARVLINETDWTATSTDTAWILDQIARNRIGHFTAHPDEQMRLAFMEDATEHRNAVHNAAYPSGRRKINLHIACFDHDTGDDGSRIPCAGTYTMILDPGAYLMPDMICSADKLHRITPSEWQRASRKAAMDPAAMGALLERIKGGVA